MIHTSRGVSCLSLNWGLLYVYREFNLRLLLSLKKNFLINSCSFTRDKIIHYGKDSLRNSLNSTRKRAAMESAYDNLFEDTSSRIIYLQSVICSRALYDQRFQRYLPSIFPVSLRTLLFLLE